ncbi:MAG: pilus assembly protein PilY [Piscinibacter sp.]|nr:pilus assembly protein PilY [Piscinibacter sp.]
MSRLMNMLHAVGASRPARWIGVPVLIAAALASLLSQSQVTLPPTVALAAEPLYARGARAKPTLTLALSVEFPTVGAQYVSTPQATTDNTYSPNTKYIGYFDTESCYTYNNNADPALRRFDRIGAASGRTCGGNGFSGNFMNWATSSAIDVLRLGLTGGDRVVDTASLTVLQRAVLPNTSVSGNFWNGSNFPSKILLASLVDGAVPNALKGSHTGDIYVANCLNRVHFGTQATGNCASPGNNSNLGVGGASPTIGVVTDFTGALPGSFSSTPCAVENATCAISGTKEVAYGAGNNWKFMTVNADVACSNAVFGDPINGTVKACYTRDASSGSGSGLTSDNFFYTRVRVCESSGATLSDPRADLCQRYPGGNFKPVGNLQKYSDRVRVAAFGYLNHSPSDPQRHGGVLRAPMKYVGEKAFDANFSLVSGTNPVREWDDVTGVFLRDPDSGGGPNSGTGSNWPGQPISGVVNYLNQFGRHGIFGQYKTRDPVGELYYESVRYLQGLQPTNIDSTVGHSAISGIDDTMRDGFPVYTNWTDPHPAVSGMTDYSCVRNNIVGIGDVNTHNDRYIPGNPSTRVGKGDAARAASNGANEPDFYFWTKVVGGFESNNSVTYTDGRGVSRTTSNPNTPVPARWGMENQNIGADNAAYYMAGIAYWANTHDIRGTQWTNTAKQRPGMRVTTYWLDVNEYGQQTDPAVHRTRNQFYFAAKYGGFKDVTESGNPFKMLSPGTKPADNSFVTDPNNLNWERQSSDPNKQEAKNYFLSSSAQEVLDALDQIFANIASEANSIAGGAISTQRLTTSGGLIYQAQFDPADWSGDVAAYAVDPAASGTQVSIGTQSVWTNLAGDRVGAAGKLDDRDITTRNIYVGYNSGTGTGIFGSAEFLWNGGLPTVIKNALKLPPGAASAPYDSDAIGEARLNYLRGERASEAGSGVTFRRRGSRLGDIVNSGVAFSGAPAQRFSDASYSAFFASHSNRQKAIFVGANDGMLHAFNADTGDELFAYIPSWVVPRLTQLTSSSYTHQSYVDSTPTISEANIGTTASPDWRTVLVSGTGGGGQGVFALDVSDPTAVSGFGGNDKVLWEFTDKHDPDLGNVVGKPQILKINTAAGTATPNYEYFAVVASGVNNHAADGSASSTAEPALFFLKLGKAKSASWSLGDNYFKVKFPVATNTITSGMIGFSATVGFGGELALIYAGDLQGNVWKLDFTKTQATNWSLNTLSPFKQSGVALPLFIAQDASAAQNRQPITMEPALVFGPNRSTVVSFGTGKFLEVGDISPPYKAQSVYAVLDNNSTTVDNAGSALSAIAGRGRLIAGTVTSGAIDVAPFNWGRPTSDTSTASRAGWYYDFYLSATTTTPANAGTGERQISNFGVLAGRLVFGSVIPALNSCDNGSGNLYVVNVLTGDGTTSPSTVGILGEPFLMQLGSPTLTRSDSVGQRKETTRWQIILQGSAGVSAPPSITTTESVGRLSWREISNYQNLRNAP